MKKFLAIVLTLAMVFTMGILAFATEGDAPEAPAVTTGSITVENAKADGIYKAYKIFDVEYITVQDENNQPVKSYLYTIAPDSPWKDLVDAYVAVATSGITLTDFNDVEKVEVTDAFSAEKFAAYLKEATLPEGAQATDLTVAGGKATATGLDFGYYFVTSSVGVIAALTTTDPDATIIEKNPFGFDKTENNDNFDLGDKVTYTVDATIPSTEGITDYVFKYTDEMTSGLDYNNDVRVEIINADNSVEATLVESTDYTVTTEGTHKFVLNLNVMNETIQANAGKTVRLTYTATLNADAITVISVNEIKLEYGHENDLKETHDDVVLYSSKIVINKYEKGNEDVKLAGAEFILYKIDNGTAKYYKRTGDVVTWVTDEAQATKYTTDADGAATFAGLADGEYFLKETAAPTGYALLKDPVAVTLNGITEINTQTNKGSEEVENQYLNDGTDFVANLGDLTVTKDIENAKGSIILPSTGGIGTTIFYVVGVMLVLGAAILLISRRRTAADVA